jgi:hypothetical protein
MIVTIYSLSDIATGYVHYIGASKSELKLRLKAHLGPDSSRKFKQLLNKGIKFRIDKIDECHITEVRIYERYWIDQMRAWGFSLTNDYRYHKYSYPKLKEELAVLNISHNAL